MGLHGSDEAMRNHHGCNLSIGCYAGIIFFQCTFNLCCPTQALRTESNRRNAALNVVHERLDQIEQRIRSIEESKEMDRVTKKWGLF
jgi:hypothetical protein